MLTLQFARAEGLPIAISGGRHNSNGASSSEGLVIDMRMMNVIRVDKDKKIGFFGGGTNVWQASKELLTYGQ